MCAVRALRRCNACYSIMSSNQRKNTLREPSCLVFGTPQLFSENVLPTYEDVMKCYLFERFQLKRDTKKDPSAKLIARKVSDRIISVWNKASIPTVTAERIFQKIMAYHAKYKNLMKSSHQKNATGFKLSCENFHKQAHNIIFDVASCKCKPISKCGCIKTKKVPKEEVDFLMDQRNERKMIIGSVDKELSRKKEQSDARKTLSKAYFERNKPGPSSADDLPVLDASFLNETSTSSSSETGDDFSPSRYHSGRSLRKRISAKSKHDANKTSHMSNKMRLTRAAEACDRAGISDRAAAILCSSLLCDVDKAPSSSPVVDRSKIRRERIRSRNKSKEEVKSINLQGIYFDGRKDSTLVTQTIEDRCYRSKIIEEHVSLVAEPGSVYLGHTTPKTGKSGDISVSILNNLSENKHNYDEISALGCDGTVVNTGYKTGVNRSLELKVGRPMHWFVCLLHANELPLRHLVAKLDGKTSGPKGFSGEVGKKLENCEQKEVIDFDPISSELTVVDRDQLSTDQQYMYEIHRAVVSGECSPELARRNPGKMAHSRWLTTANRLLRLYVSEESPSENLLLIVDYVVKVYVPVWFSIKVNWNCVDGSQNLFKLIQYSRNLPAKVVDIVKPVIQNNAFFAHPEKFLLSMICDSRSFIREIGWRRINKCKETEREKSVRIFRVPKLRFEAEDYTNMIDWQETLISEPPLTRNMSPEDIEENIKTKAVFHALEFPNHTQAVERCVKLVTEASIAVIGQEKREGFIRNRIASRKKMPSFDTKSQFVR